jgi:hypothetical protein
MVAPMNSEGEKIPPEAPEPRLTEVAASLAANRSKSSAGKIAQIGIFDALENVFGEAQAADEGRSRDTDQSAEQGIQEQRVKGGRRLRRQKRVRNAEGGVNSKEDAADERRRAGGERHRQEGARA